MRQSHKIDLNEHNRRQVRYFDPSVKRTMVPTDSPYLRRHVDELLHFADISPGERVLEVGCGMGRYTLLLAEQGVDVTGLDLSPVLLDRLRAHDGGRYNIRLYCADILQPLVELYHQFDAVIGFFTLHHLHDIPECLAAMPRLLKEDGPIVFLEPNALNPLYYIQIAITPGMTWQGEKGIAKMRPGYILPAMKAAGLTDVQVRRFGFFPPLITNQPLGAQLESVLERFPLWRQLLPFQLFKGRRR